MRTPDSGYDSTAKVFSIPWNMEPVARDATCIRNDDPTVSEYSPWVSSD